MLSLLVNVSEPLIDFHEKFLHDIEYILFIWDKNGFDSLPPLSTVLNEILKWMSVCFLFYFSEKKISFIHSLIN